MHLNPIWTQFEVIIFLKQHKSNIWILQMQVCRLLVNARRSHLEKVYSAQTDKKISDHCLELNRNYSFK